MAKNISLHPFCPKAAHKGHQTNRERRPGHSFRSKKSSYFLRWVNSLGKYHHKITINMQLLLSLSLLTAVSGAALNRKDYNTFEQIHSIPEGWKAVESPINDDPLEFKLALHAVRIPQYVIFQKQRY
jgi:hypothetical protein